MIHPVFHYFWTFFLWPVFSSLVWALLGFVQLLLCSGKSVLHTHLLYLFYLLLFCLGHSLFWPFLLSLLILLSMIFCLFPWSSHSILTLFSSWSDHTGRGHLVPQQLRWRSGQSTKWSFRSSLAGHRKDKLFQNQHRLQPTPYSRVWNVVFKQVRTDYKNVFFAL